MNLPRMNLLLRELEEGTGGVLLDATGSSIWLFRCVVWDCWWVGKVCVFGICRQLNS